jgi:DNA-binding MarR family transcriptional regulator
MGKKRKLAAMAQEIDRDLQVVRQALRKPLETVIASGGLTGPQRGVMRALVGAEAMSLKELSAAVGLEHSTVSGIVDRLEERGMVKRRADETDGRLSRISVTRGVRDFVEHAMPALTVDPLVEALGRAKGEERKRILEGVRLLRRVVEETEPGRGET